MRMGYDDSNLGRKLRRETISVELATAVLEAIDVLPAELGL